MRARSVLWGVWRRGDRRPENDREKRMVKRNDDTHAQEIRTPMISCSEENDIEGRGHGGCPESHQPSDVLNRFDYADTVIHYHARLAPG